MVRIIEGIAEALRTEGFSVEDHGDGHMLYIYHDPHSTKVTYLEHYDGLVQIWPHNGKRPPHYFNIEEPNSLTEIITLLQGLQKCSK